MFMPTFAIEETSAGKHTTSNCRKAEMYRLWRIIPYQDQKKLSKPPQQMGHEEQGRISSHLLLHIGKECCTLKNEFLQSLNVEYLTFVISIWSCRLFIIVPHFSIFLLLGISCPKSMS